MSSGRSGPPKVAFTRELCSSSSNPTAKALVVQLRSTHANLAPSRKVKEEA